MPHLHYRIPKVYPIPPTIPYNGVTYNALQILFPVSRFYIGNFSLAPTGALCAIVVYKIPSQVPHPTWNSDSDIHDSWGTGFLHT